MKKKILILCLSILCLCASAKQRVILITIDGLRSDILSNGNQPAPFLHEMMRKSVYVPNVIVVNPTMTYPSHTTLVTGSTPLDHGIHCNRQFQFNRAEPALYNWYADSIRTKTLWQNLSVRLQDIFLTLPYVPALSNMMPRWQVW